jgi:hypothetical protein
MSGPAPRTTPPQAHHTTHPRRNPDEHARNDHAARGLHGARHRPRHHGRTRRHRHPRPVPRRRGILHRGRRVRRCRRVHGSELHEPPPGRPRRKPARRGRRTRTPLPAVHQHAHHRHGARHGHPHGCGRRRRPHGRRPDPAVHPGHRVPRLVGGRRPRTAEAPPRPPPPPQVRHRPGSASCRAGWISSAPRHRSRTHSPALGPAHLPPPEWPPQEPDPHRPNHWPHPLDRHHHRPRRCHRQRHPRNRVIRLPGSHRLDRLHARCPRR